jgi:hypothetical protein
MGEFFRLLLPVGLENLGCDCDQSICLRPGMVVGQA